MDFPSNILQVQLPRVIQFLHYQHMLCSGLWYFGGDHTRRIYFYSARITELLFLFQSQKSRFYHQMKVIIISLSKTTGRGEGAIVGMNNESMNGGTCLSLQTCKAWKMKRHREVQGPIMSGAGFLRGSSILIIDKITKEATTTRATWHMNLEQYTVHIYNRSNALENTWKIKLRSSEIIAMKVEIRQQQTQQQ